MRWAQYFKLQSRHSPLLHKLFKLSLSHLHAIVGEVILDFFRVKNVEPVLLVIGNSGVRSHRRHILIGILKASVRRCWAPVAWPVLILRVSPVSLVRVLPLSLLLFFEHGLHIFLHRHRELSISIHRCVVASVQFCVLVVHIHATATWEVSVTEYHALYLIEKWLIFILQCLLTLRPF